MILSTITVKLVIIVIIVDKAVRFIVDKNVNCSPTFHTYIL